MSPTQLTLKHLRTLGYHAAVVERWNMYAHIRQDLYGYIDILGVHPARPGVLGVQCTTGDHAAARIAKAKGNAAMMAWILAGNPLVVHGWVMRKHRNADGSWSKRGTWELREIPLTREHLAETVGEMGCQSAMK